MAHQLKTGRTNIYYSDDYASMSTSTQNQIGTSKVFILDKYFSELQKFWDTEKRLKGKKETTTSHFFRAFFSCVGKMIDIKTCAEKIAELGKLIIKAFSWNRITKTFSDLHTCVEVTTLSAIF